MDAGMRGLRVRNISSTVGYGCRLLEPKTGLSTKYLTGCGVYVTADGMQM